MDFRFAQHPSENDERVCKKFLAAWLLSDHELKEYSEVCQGGVPDLCTKEESLCVWLEKPKPRDYTKFSQQFDFQLYMDITGLNTSHINQTLWTIEKKDENLYSLNGESIECIIVNLGG